METKSLISEIEKVVSEINEEITGIVDDNVFLEEFPIEVECISNGRSAAVMFLGFRLWANDDDDRLFIANTKEEAREPIKYYLTKEINRIIKQIASIGRVSAN